MNTAEYFSAIERSGVMPFAAAWIELEIISEINHKGKDRYHTLSLIYGISTETDSDIEHRLVVLRGRGPGRVGLVVWTRRYELSSIGWMNNKVLLYRTGNYIR